MGEETTDENELNMAGLAMFPREWAGVFAADETPPKRGYCVQNTAPRLSGEAIVRQKRNRNPRKKKYVAGKSHERRRII